MGACILCGIDGSREAGRAAALAARLARDLDARAMLLHVDEDAARRRPVRWPAPRRAWRKRRLLKATANECCFPSGTELRLEKGDPTAALFTVVEEQDAELVVVSTGGRDTASPALLGGTASALMRRCPCPVVVVVPATSVVPLDADSMRDVVCAVEGRPGDVPVIGLAADLARRLDAELHVVAGSESGVGTDESAEDRLTGALEGTGLEAHTHVLALPTDDAVEQVASEQRAALAVVGPPEGGEPGPVLNGPVAVRLAAAGSTALVVLPSKADLHFGSGHYELATTP